CSPPEFWDVKRSSLDQASAAGSSIHILLAHKQLRKYRRGRTCLPVPAPGAPPILQSRDRVPESTQNKTAHSRRDEDRRSPPPAFHASRSRRAQQFPPCRPDGARAA